MCSTGQILGALVGGGLALATGGTSLTASGAMMGVATGAATGATIGGMFTPPKVATPQPVAGAPNPVTDQTTAQDTARAAATARRRALGTGSPRSLLATAGGSLGDMSMAQIGFATAAPVTKATLGA